MSVRTHRTTSFLPLILVAYLAVGCKDPMTTTPIDAGAVGFDRTEEGLPFQLTGDAVLVDQILAPDFGPPDFGKSDFGGRCSAQSDFVIRFSIAGQATHMGNVTASEEHCSLVDFATGLTLSDGDGEMIITAANGDELWVGHHRSPGEQDHGQFTGGTGRFTDPSGDAMLRVASCDRSAGTCVLEIEGVLAYDAFDRSE